MSKPSRRSHDITTNDGSKLLSVEPDQHQIQELAYQLWLERGCPLGSPEDDWFRAEAELKSRTEIASAAAA